MTKTGALRLPEAIAVSGPRLSGTPMPLERSGTEPDRLGSPQARSLDGSNEGGEGSSRRISPGGGVASLLAETITDRRALQQRQRKEDGLQTEPAGMRYFPGPASGPPRQRRWRPDPLSVGSAQCDEVFGMPLDRASRRAPATAWSARDLRPRLGLLDFAGSDGSWEGFSAGTRARAVSVRGGESPFELDRLHKLARQRAAQLQRDGSLALAIWDGHHDLVSHGARAETRATHEGSEAEGLCGTHWVSVPALSLLLVLCGCGSQLPYELMNSVDRGCGTLIAVCEALFGLAATAPSALRQAWTVPVHTHVGIAAAAVLYPLLLNQALASSLPIVLLSTLKNGNLVANALVGVLVLGKRYSARQMSSIVVVSAGLVLTGLSGTTSNDGSAESVDTSPLCFEGAVAVACLAGALLARALTGGLQEAAFAKCDGTRASADEMLFFQNLFGKSTHKAAGHMYASLVVAYMHIVAHTRGDQPDLRVSPVGLPVLLVRGVLLSQDDPVNGIVPHAVKWWREPLLGGTWPWPSIFGLLLANLIFSHACKFVCAKLIGHRNGGSLHTTLVLTLQKFCAFVVSLLFLSPDAERLRRSVPLWLGAAAIVSGSCAFSACAAPANMRVSNTHGTKKAN